MRELGINSLRLALCADTAAGRCDSSVLFVGIPLFLMGIGINSLRLALCADDPASRCKYIPVSSALASMPAKLAGSSALYISPLRVSFYLKYQKVLSIICYQYGEIEEVNHSIQVRLRPSETG